MSERHEAEEAPSAASQLFDLRTIIAVLFGVYGIVLTIQGAFFDDEAQLAKAGGIEINLWSGIVMIVVAALFYLWVRLRPLVPPGGRS
jgi:drug/metabolite transporter (DMT)-like permease